MSRNRTSLFITKSSRFQCALLSVKAAANIQTFFITKQIKFKVFFEPILSRFYKNESAFLTEKREGKDTTFFPL